MLKKIIKNLLKKVSKVDYKLFTIAVLGTLLATGFVFAYQGGTTTVIEEAHDFIIEGGCKIAEEIGLGASADFCAGDEPVTNMCVVDIYDLTVAAGGFTSTGSVTMSGENSLTGTTSIPMLDASFQVDLDFQQATSGQAVAIEGTQIIPGSIQNTGGDLLCTDTWLDISTANGLFAATLKVGTSTAATSTDAHLIADTNITTTTVDILSKEDDEGTETDEVWIFAADEYLVVTQTFQVANATSSDSFTTAGGNLQEGKLHVNCRSRY